VRIVAFDALAGTSRDVTEEIAAKLRHRCSDQDEVPTILGGVPSAPGRRPRWWRLRSGANSLSIQRWKRFGLLASVAWMVAGGLLALRNETWIAAWRL
jgi:hypothetical protein